MPAPCSVPCGFVQSSANRTYRSANGRTRTNNLMFVVSGSNVIALVRFYDTTDNNYSVRWRVCCPTGGQTRNIHCCCCSCAQLAPLYFFLRLLTRPISLSDVTRPLLTHYCTRGATQPFCYGRWRPMPCEPPLLRLATRSA